MIIPCWGRVSPPFHWMIVSWNTTLEGIPMGPSLRLPLYENIELDGNTMLEEEFSKSICLTRIIVRLKGQFTLTP